MRSTVQSKVLGQEDCRTVYTSDEISWMERCGLGHSILTCKGQAGSREPWQRSRDKSLEAVSFAAQIIIHSTCAE